MWGDAEGLGMVMIDQLAEMGWRINRFHGGKASNEPDKYVNLIGEVWHVGAREIERGRVNLGQFDPADLPSAHDAAQRVERQREAAGGEQGEDAEGWDRLARQGGCAAGCDRLRGEDERRDHGRGCGGWGDCDRRLQLGGGEVLMAKGHLKGVLPSSAMSRG